MELEEGSDQTFISSSTVYGIICDKGGSKTIK